MKKALLAGFVVVSFLAYSFHQRNDGGGRLILRSAESSSGTPSNVISSPTGSGVNSKQPTSSGDGAAQVVGYKNGVYTGSVEDAYYGYVQVQVTITDGKISDVTFLQHPNDNETSRYINSQAMPYLKQEAIQAQSAHVNTITGATDTSLAFIQSLTAALSHAS